MQPARQLLAGKPVVAWQLEEVWRMLTLHGTLQVTKTTCAKLQGYVLLRHFVRSAVKVAGWEGHKVAFAEDCVPQQQDTLLHSAPAWFTADSAALVLQGCSLTWVWRVCCCRALPLTGVMARTRAMAVAEAKAQAARSRDISIRMQQEMLGPQPVALPV